MLAACSSFLPSIRHVPATIVREMLPHLYRFVWRSLHALFVVLLSVHRIWSDSVRRLAATFEPSVAHPDERDRQLIEKCLHQLDKVPRHVVVILNADEPVDGQSEADVLSALVRWARVAGIEHISFYDYRGPIDEQRPKLHRTLSAHRIVGQTNGHSNGNGLATQPSGKTLPIAVHFIDPATNRQHFVRAMRSISRTVTDSADITIPVVNAAVQQALNASYPEPELAFYFDEHCCTYGFSPWQIRLTEFVRLERAVRDVRLGSFMRALYKYAKCEQRFGK